MSLSLVSWFVIVLAAIAANLPFLNEHLFSLVPIKHAFKSLWLRLLELIILYFLVGGIAFLLEARIGSAFPPQGWEFYAITACLFLVLAFPGFVFRYLRKRHG